MEFLDKNRVRVVPKRPTIKFTRNKVKYTITDLDGLSELGYDVLRICIQIMMQNRGVEECRMCVGENVSDEDIKTAMDDVMGYDIKAKGEWSVGIHAITYVRLEDDETGKRILTCQPGSTFSEMVYDYFHKIKPEDAFDMRDFAVYAVDKLQKELEETVIA